MNGLELIAEEQEHARSLGYDKVHDDQHDQGELARAAACLIEKAVQSDEGSDIDWPHPFWPEGFDSSRYDGKSDIELLVIAGQFIVSEIDRKLSLLIPGEHVEDTRHE